MAEYKTIKEILENQHVLRQRVLGYVKRNGILIRHWAPTVGLSLITLNRFLLLGKDLRWTAFCKLEKFMNEKA